MSEIIDDIRRVMEIMEQLPPPPVFASSKLYSRTHAFSFKDGGRDYVVAHPDLFAQIPVDQARRNPLCGIPIHDIDYDDEMRESVMSAMSRAMSHAAVEGE